MKGRRTMVFKNIVISLGFASSIALLAACASQPAATSAAPSQAATPAKAAAPAAQNNEAQTAAALDKEFQDAARSYKVVERDGKTLYCKREKVMGSTIPTMQCLTESQLRNQIEATKEVKRRMNRPGGCVQTGGCTGGG
jgi:hypothetical protein